MKIYTINVDFTQPKDIRLVLPTAESIGIKLTGSKGWRNGRYAYLDGRSVYGSSAFYTFDNTDTSKTFVIDKPVDGNLVVLNSSAGGLKIKFNLYIEVADESVTSQADVTVSETIDAGSNPVTSNAIAQAFAQMGYAFGKTYACYIPDYPPHWEIYSPASGKLENIPENTTKLLIGKDIILEEGIWANPSQTWPDRVYYIWLEDGATYFPNLIGTKNWNSMMTLNVPSTVETFATGNMPYATKLIVRGGYESAMLSMWSPNDIKLNQDAVVYFDDESMARDMYNNLGKGAAGGYTFKYPEVVEYTPQS